MGATPRLLISAVLFLISTVAAHGLPPIGSPAPSFSALKLADLQPVGSSELFAADTLTLLSFFTTWCKPCEKEIPELLELVQRFGERGFHVVLVSLDQSEAEEIRGFLTRVKAGSLPAVWDEAGELMALFEVFSLPANILIEPGGAVTMAWQGYLPDKLRELEARLDKLP